MLAFDEEVITTDKLACPIPDAKQEICFVAFLDLGLNWKHPILHKTVEMLSLPDDRMYSCEYCANPATVSFEQFNYVVA
jgi:hypothetical protein